MGKIVLEIEEFAKTYSEYKIFDQECIHIGRGFNNDIIINDPFVGAAHLSLRFIEGVWACESNTSLNGTFVSKSKDGRTKIKVEGIHPIASGDTIFLGKTSIHVWDSNQPVLPEQALDTRSTLLFDPQDTIKNLLFALGVFGFIYYLYLSQLILKTNNSFFQIIIGVCFLAFCLVIWSGVWALLTRFTKRQHRFMDHLIFSFHWAVISIAASFVFSYIFFFVCSYSIAYVASLLIFALFGVYILNNHLNIATNLTFSKRLIISSSIAFSIFLLSVFGYYATRNEFSPNPHHYVNMVPVPKKFIPAISINKEIKRLDSIFEE